VSRAVNDLLLRLQESDAAQSRFIAAAAHELRSPITALTGELELALRRPRPAEELREALGRAKETTDELRALVESLLGLARVDAGQVELSRQTERASALAQRALRSEAAALEAAGNGVTLTLAADPEVSVNGALVEVALANLLRNAARYAPGAPVTLCVQADGEFVTFVVDDEGPGLNPAELERAFERFVRLGDRATPGAGLGLALARGIARRHGGDVWLEARPGGGLRAVLRLGR
jgi:signal transduction histidine kinase